MAEEGTPQEPADKATLTDDLNAAFDALEEPEGEEQQAADTEQEEPESTAETESSQEEAAPDETPASGDSEAEEAEEPDEVPIEPPQHWAEEDKQVFRDAPQEAQEFLLRRHRDMEADYTRKSQEVAEVRKALEPIKQSLELNGMSEGDYITRLRAADQYLSNSPQEAIQWLANSYGVDLSQFGQSQESEDDEFKDPYVQQLERKVQELEGKFQSREQQEQQASQQQLQQQVNEFANATDEQGSPKHPHFEAVKTHMGALMQSGAAGTLEEAYDQAVWARPDLREQLLESQKREAAQQEEQRRKEKAQKAKKATTPASSGTTTEAPEAPADLRSDLERQFDKLSS